MDIIRLRSWSRFKELLHSYAALPADERGELWFRGQSDSNWPLQTTLDRFASFTDREHRFAVAQRLLGRFRQELIGIGSRDEAPEGVALELLARHHGLPSDLLDWTESPYIAAYFALEGTLTTRPRSVAIWVLNLGLLSHDNPEVQPIRSRELFWSNPRALSQRGVFLRLRSADRSAENILGEALTKWVLSPTERIIALRDLEAMNITARNLFRDFEGAARSAITGLRLEGEEHV
jgi:hypothetical protein